MKVLVTGGAGGVGSAVAREFLEHGYEVRLFDIAAPDADLRERCEVVYGDLQDRLGLLRALEGVEGVAHLAAIPNPVHGNDKVLFGPNVLGTQMLLDVAAEFEIQRFVLASSCSIYGFPFQRRAWDNEKPNPLEPQYLPMDENHPVLCEDVYALSKQCNELTAAMYTRRTGMATTCLRLTFVADFIGRPKWLQRHIKYASEWKNNDLWAYVERRDAARAFRLAIEKIENGHHIIQICAQDSLVGDKRAALERHFPQLVPFLDNGFDYETYGFWDSRRAQELLGWNSQLHWRDFMPTED